jgi:hypothetical protein
MGIEKMTESIHLERLLDPLGRVQKSVSLEIDSPTTLYLPDSLVLKFDKKKEQSDEEAVQKHSEEFAGVDNGVISNNNTGPDNKPRMFVDISVDISYTFNPEDGNKVKKEILIRFDQSKMLFGPVITGP